MAWIGGGGNDLFNGGSAADSAYGGAGNDLINGGAGSDVLAGQAGNDALFGGDGNDYLNGGAGNDLMSGGAGIDWADYGDATAGVRIDLAWLLPQNTVGAGYDMLWSIERINGSGFNDMLKGDGGANLFQGNAGADGLYGASGNDTLIGGAGNDRLEGGLGRDYYEGGLGDDVYVSDDTNEFVLELAGQGADTIFTSATHTLETNVENMVLTGLAAINGWGNLANNLMTGNTAANTIYGYEGDDTLRGGDGNDTLGGGDQNDLIDGGAGIDTFTFATSGIAVTVDLRLTTAQDTGRGLDRLSSIENIVGSDNSDTFTANAAVNRFEGMIGADTYKFFSLADLNGDTVVKGTGAGDRIDLSGIDANTALAGDQAFSLVSAFTGQAGQALYAFASGASTATLQLDVNGDGVADASMTVLGDVATMGWVL